MKIGDLVTYKGKANQPLQGIIGIVIARGEGKFSWMIQVLFPSYSPDPVHIRVDHLRAVP